MERELKMPSYGNSQQQLGAECSEGRSISSKLWNSKTMRAGTPGILWEFLPKEYLKKSRTALSRRGRSVKTGYLWPFCRRPKRRRPRGGYARRFGERFPERFLQNRVEIAAFSRDGRFFQSIPNHVAWISRLLAGGLLAIAMLALNIACSGRSFELLLGSKLSNASPTTSTPPSPTTPADLVAANAGGQTIRLTWVASKDDTTPHANMIYEICQATTSGACSGGSFSVTYTVTGQTSFITPALANNTTYFFTMRAKNVHGNTSAVSPQVRVTAAANPVWQQTAYLKAPNTGTNDIFGYSVAISGDTIVVGNSVACL